MYRVHGYVRAWNQEKKTQLTVSSFCSIQSSIEYMVGYIFLITFVSDFALLYIVLTHLKKEEGINWLMRYNNIWFSLKTI